VRSFVAYHHTTVSEHMPKSLLKRFEMF